MATFLQTIGRGAAVAGKKLGLPEFGISERLGDRPRAQAPAPRQVQGASTKLPSAPPLATQRSVGGNYGGGGGAPAGGQPNANLNFGNVFDYGAPEQAGIDFDSLIRPALDALESTIPTLQQGFNEYETGQRGQQETQLAQNRQAIGEQEGVLGRSKVQQQQAGESAIDESRRQFSEIQQGLQARYGGATGTGAFASELAGRETVRNIGNVRTQLGQAIQQIDDKLVQVKEIGRIAEQDIVQKTEERIRQAREGLNLQIADIRRQQGVLQADKARMTADSVQQYQNAVNQHKAQQADFIRNLYVQQTNAENQLKLAQQKAADTAKSFSVQDLTGLAKQFTPAGLQFSATGSLGEGGTFNNPRFSVSSGKTDEDSFEEKLKKAAQALGAQQ